MNKNKPKVFDTTVLLDGLQHYLLLGFYKTCPTV